MTRISTPTIEVPREELIREYQKRATEPAPHIDVYVDLESGETELAIQHDFREWYRTQADAFIARDPTDLVALTEDGGISEGDQEAWAAAIELRDEIPQRFTSPKIGPVKVEYV